MRVTVFGATGRTGRELVPRLVAGGHDVTGVVRRPEQVAGVEAQGATGYLGDVEGGEHGDLGPALRGADVVVWAAGASRLDAAGHSDRIRDGGLRAIAAGAEAGVGRWIQVSSMFANRAAEGPPVMAAALHNKLVMDEALQRSGLKWTVLRPGGLLDTPATGLVRVAATLDPDPITRADVAAFIVELIGTGKGVGAEFDMANDASTSISKSVDGL